MSKIIYIFQKISEYLGIKDLLKISSNQLIEIIKKKEKNQDPKVLLNYGYSVFSQGDEDGIINEIFNRIKIKNRKFIELGVENGLENNTTNLLLNNWSGLWFEGDKKWKKQIDKNFSQLIENQKLKIKYKLINKNNINDYLMKEFKENENIDFLSIDIGLQTYHVLKAINSIKPRVISVEYNARLGPNNLWIADNEDKMMWNNDIYYGASLKSYENMLNKKGYSLVGCSLTGVNAFFINNKENLELFQTPFSTENHYQEERIYLLKYFASYHKKKFGEFLIE